MRPLISEHVDGPHYEQRGYMIRGSRHKLKCRCYACQVVRRRAREKRTLDKLFHCG